MTNQPSSSTGQPGIGPAARAAPATPEEPVLAMANIQGNGIVGFNKRFQTLLHFHIDDAARFKPAVAALGGRVATAEEVLAFNRLFKRDAIHCSRRHWMNLAFTYAGLAKLRDDVDPLRRCLLPPRYGPPIGRAGRPGGPERSGQPAQLEGQGRYRGPHDHRCRGYRGPPERQGREVRELIEGNGGATGIRSDEGAPSRGPRKLRGARALRISRRHLATATARPRFRGRDRFVTDRSAGAIRTMAREVRTSSGPASSSSATAIRLGGGTRGLPTGSRTARAFGWSRNGRRTAPTWCSAGSGRTSTCSTST